MPVEGFDDASKNISKRGSSRRKASRDAYSNSIQAGAEKKKAAAAAKKVATAAEEADFGKYATDGQKSRYKANRTFRAGGSKAKFRSGVVAKGKAAEAAKQAKKPATTQESLLNIKNEFVGFKPFEEANKGGNITKTTTPKVRPKAKTVETKVKPATEIKAPAAKVPAAKAPKMANTGFTSAADRIRNKGVSNLKPTPSKTKKGSYNFSEGTGPNTSVFDKTKNVAPKTEEKAKRKKRAAKGSRAATLKKGFGY